MKPPLNITFKIDINFNNKHVHGSTSYITIVQKLFLWLYGMGFWVLKNDILSLCVQIRSLCVTSACVPMLQLRCCCFCISITIIVPKISVINWSRYLFIYLSHAWTKSIFFCSIRKIKVVFLCCDANQILCFIQIHFRMFFRMT